MYDSSSKIILTLFVSVKTHQENHLLTKHVETLSSVSVPSECDDRRLVNGLIY